MPACLHCNEASIFLHVCVHLHMHGNACMLFLYVLGMIITAFSTSPTPVILQLFLGVVSQKVHVGQVKLFSSIRQREHSQRFVCQQSQVMCRIGYKSVNSFTPMKYSLFYCMYCWVSLCTRIPHSSRCKDAKWENDQTKRRKVAKASTVCFKHPTIFVCKCSTFSKAYTTTLRELI